MTAYLAAEGFENELRVELQGDVLETRERLIISGSSHFDAAWALNVWHKPQEITFESIGDAAKKLRALAPRWALYSTTLHRRAELIQEQISKGQRTKPRELGFLEPVPSAPLGSWTLIDENRLLASPRCSSPFPNGEIRFKEDKQGPPSRAYLKLWELFTLHGISPKAGESCVDLGASPGGWTWVLAKLGCRVTAVDRSPLAEEIARLPGVTFVKGNAFTIRPSELGSVDWVFSDVISEPQQIEKLIATWQASGLARNLVCTVKFKGETDPEVRMRLGKIPGARIRHLFHNKHELTWWLTT